MIFEVQPCLRWYIYLPRHSLHLAVNFSSLFTNIHKLPSVFVLLHSLLTLRTTVPSHLSRRTPLSFLRRSFPLSSSHTRTQSWLSVLNLRTPTSAFPCYRQFGSTELIEYQDWCLLTAYQLIRPRGRRCFGKLLQVYSSVVCRSFEQFQC